MLLQCFCNAFASLALQLHLLLGQALLLIHSMGFDQLGYLDES